MDEARFGWSTDKYKLPYHWIRDPLHKDSLPYFGYVQLALNELPPSPAAVLDAGCGDGRISAEMVRRGYSVTGVDYLELSVLYAKAFVPEGRFFVADLSKDLIVHYGLCSEQFDAVVMLEVYEHVLPEKSSLVLDSLYNVLRPGGILILSVPSNLLPLSILHCRHFDREVLVQELQTAGFRIQKMLCQHRTDRFIKWLLSDGLEAFLNNRWLQPVFLKRLRRRFYMKYANIVHDEKRSGRFVAIAVR